MTIHIATLGFPRIGAHRELKSNLERFWAGESSQETLLDSARALRQTAWKLQKDQGADVIPSNDFSLYDHVLDLAAMVGAIPKRFHQEKGGVSLATYFAMARGIQNVPAGEMTKWFDTNYHYLVPEFSREQTFHVSSTKIVDDFLHARSCGFETRPVLVGPVTFLRLGKMRDSAEEDPLNLLERLLPVYRDILARLVAAGATWVQLDEPGCVSEHDPAVAEALKRTYTYLVAALPQLKVMLTSYFSGLGNVAQTIVSLPVHGLHLDVVRAPEQLSDVVPKVPSSMLLSLGVVDGRNIWRADLTRWVDMLTPIYASRGALQLAPSCSLLHVPLDVSRETGIDAELRRCLAFATQKIEELHILSEALSKGRETVQPALDAARQAIEWRNTSPKVNDVRVKQRVAQRGGSLLSRQSAYACRKSAQQSVLKLPLFPTTTIGSFPQTAEIRRARAAHTRKELDDVAYIAFLEDATRKAIRWQESVGLDVLVHGEFERNDMVQYFGEQLEGFAFTRFAWVQSYGSRCVRPPIVFGDVSRRNPMTVDWWRFAQSLTHRPVKAMLTGPVTLLNWSFVRDDLSRAEICRQLAFAIRDEVLDLEAAGAKIIQIDEAALREGLPLQQEEGKAYLEWAIDCFKLASSGVADTTQIHTHMCYSAFNEIMPSICAMDADVISIETARSKMELLEAFEHCAYPAGIGPGVYDIHSPRIPSYEEIIDLLNAARHRLRDEQLWINPDCGLKTRGWDEVIPAIAAMVKAAKMLRKEDVTEH